MRLLRCCRCENEFNEEDADVRSEKVGEFWGAPAYMDYNSCPCCGCTDLEEVYPDD